MYYRSSGRSLSKPRPSPGTVGGIARYPCSSRLESCCSRRSLFALLYTLSSSSAASHDRWLCFWEGRSALFPYLAFFFPRALFIESSTYPTGRFATTLPPFLAFVLLLPASVVATGGTAPTSIAPGLFRVLALTSVRLDFALS